MKIIVLGSGLLGVSTAYALAKRGHEVEVIDRNQATAMETSHANGGQLSYSHAEPWANPHVLKKLPKWLLHEDSPLIFRPRADLAMIKWGLQFLRNCTFAKAEANCITMLKLGLYSRHKMAELCADTGIEFDFKNAGILHIFSHEKDLEQASKQAEFQARYGCTETLLDRAGVLAHEPALAQTTRPIAGGIFSGMDESGDAKKYCEQLEAYCTRTFGTKFTYGTSVLGIEHEGGKVISIATDKGRIKADAYVMALGSYSPIYLRPLGIKLPIYPMKGYSITVPSDALTLSRSLTDGGYKIVYSQLGDTIRVAGTAEFAGYNDTIRQSRIDPIVRACKTLFPHVAWEKHEPWACLRPSTPDGPPYLGVTPIRNLFLNTGHGTLGWTQAAGSAAFVADCIEGKTPEISDQGLTLNSRS